MVIETKYERLQKVFFVKDNKIKEDKIVGIEFEHGKIGARVVPFDKVIYHFSDGFFHGSTFTRLETEVFPTKELLMAAM